HSAEFVNERSRPPTSIGTIGLISNCSSGPATRATLLPSLGRTSGLKSSVAGRTPELVDGPPDVHHAGASAEHEEQYEQPRPGPEPAVEQPADPDADDQRRDQFHADPKGQPQGTSLGRARRASFDMRLRATRLRRPKPIL